MPPNMPAFVESIESSQQHFEKRGTSGYVDKSIRLLVKVVHESPQQLCDMTCPGLAPIIIKRDRVDPKKQQYFDEALKVPKDNYMLIDVRLDSRQSSSVKVRYGFIQKRPKPVKKERALIILEKFKEKNPHLIDQINGVRNEPTCVKQDVPTVAREKTVLTRNSSQMLSSSHSGLTNNQTAREATEYLLNRNRFPTPPEDVDMHDSPMETEDISEDPQQVSHLNEQLKKQQLEIETLKEAYLEQDRAIEHLKTVITSLDKKVSVQEHQINKVNVGLKYYLAKIEELQGYAEDFKKKHKAQQAN